MSDLHVRPATVDDDAALARIDELVWSPLNSPAPPSSGDPFFTERTTPEQIRVAERGDRVVGYVKVVSPYPFPSGAHVRSIHGLGVDPSEQGRGTGRALIERACAEAREEGARRITLRVMADNDTARRLYERLGFTVEGVLPGEFCFDGRYLDDVLMGKALNRP